MTSLVRFQSLRGEISREFILENLLFFVRVFPACAARFPVRLIDHPPDRAEYQQKDALPENLSAVLRIRRKENFHAVISIRMYGGRNRRRSGHVPPLSESGRGLKSAAPSGKQPRTNLLPVFF